MVQQARKTEIYDALVCGDLLTALPHIAQTEFGGPCDLVLAADVLCYFERLEGLMAAVVAIFKSGGLFAFSVEPCVEALTDSAACKADDVVELPGNATRYKHRIEYVQACAELAGMEIVACRKTIGRYAKSITPVPYTLLLLRCRVSGMAM